MSFTYKPIKGISGQRNFLVFLLDFEVGGGFDLFTRYLKEHYHLLLVIRIYGCGWNRDRSGRDRESKRDRKDRDKDKERYDKDKERYDTSSRPFFSLLFFSCRCCDRCFGCFTGRIKAWPLGARRGLLRA